MKNEINIKEILPSIIPENCSFDFLENTEEEIDHCIFTREGALNKVEVFIFGILCTPEHKWKIRVYTDIVIRKVKMHFITLPLEDLDGVRKSIEKFFSLEENFTNIFKLEDLSD